MLDLSDPSHQGLCVVVLVLVISAYLFFAREAPTVYGERPKDALKNGKQRQVEQPSPKTKRAKAARVPKSASSSSGRRQRSRLQHCPYRTLCARVALGTPVRETAIATYHNNLGDSL
jgi:hypothetical protein